MEVYHHGNIRKTRKQGHKLTPFPINQTIFWEKQELFLPAVYVGKEGAVLDICAKIPTENMEIFLAKWNKTRRLSLATPEEFEQMEADNPAGKEFATDLRLDNTRLLRRESSSLNWYPQEIFRLGNECPDKTDLPNTEEYRNEKSADRLMDAYGCDKRYCWHFGRISYDWENKSPILNPQEMSLAFRADPISVTTSHFSTDSSCNEETIQTVHPITGQIFTLTLHECRQTRCSFKDIGEKGMIYPEYCRTLSYSISPEINREYFDIRDCSESDSPKPSDSCGQSDRSNGATAVFFAGKNSAPDHRVAISSLHFEPVSEIQWRTVFQIKPRDDMEITLSIPTTI